MCLSLLGSILHDLTDNIYVPIAVVVIAASLQLIFMIQFLSVCWREKYLPEPLWNAAILSSVFPSITLPGSYLFCEVIRMTSISFGLIAACFIIPIANYRTLFTSALPPVANNPTVGILQAGSSIICSGYILTPLFGRIDDGGSGAHIGTFLFALSTAGFATTLIALFQRRKLLWSLGMVDSFAACTFPFSNTAIAAGLYQTAHFAPGDSLAVWVLFLSILALLITTTVDFFFFWSFFYVLVPIEASLPLHTLEAGLHVAVMCTDLQGTSSGSESEQANKNGDLSSVTAMDEL